MTRRRATRSRTLLRRRRGTGVLVALVLVAGCTVAGIGPASASPVGTPIDGSDLASEEAQAATLNAQVTKLEARAEIATEKYDGVEAQLSDIVTQTIGATQRLDALNVSNTEAQAAATQRISAIYMSGGELSLYATVLDGDSPTDMFTRMHTVQSLVDDDTAQEDGTASAVTAATTTEQRLAALSTQQENLSRAATAASQQVTSLLDASRSALSGTNATIRALMEADAANAEQAAEAAAHTQLETSGTPLGKVPPGNPYAAAAIAAAHSKIGDPYVWGATGPNSFDCSGLVQWAYRQAGLQLMRVAADQWRSGPQVPLSQLAPGDLLFYATDPAVKSTIHHVTLYIGNGQMIEAPHTGAFVQQVPIRTGPEFAGAVRPGLGTATTATP